MLNKISFILLTFGLCGMVQGSALSDLSQNSNSSVKNLLGIYCMVESVLNLEDSADEFSYQVSKRCGPEATANLTKELSDASELMQITSNVTDINDKVCENADFNLNTDSDKQPSDDCANQLKNEMASLNTSYRKTRTDINKGIQQPYGAPACVQMARKNFKFLLSIFPLRIEACAKLVSTV
ncbi:hypothetical protein FF38_03333 [Lucilia cuprina]|uniref:Protein TsetseEP domain-containing protein n=1 Tax=Lucilia cuprina TaxID=7375 RepID=A0A0L0C271_LUCCU|nr:hypothetical protein FF38_03333 [Lucilia cuprina]